MFFHIARWQDIRVVRDINLKYKYIYIQIHVYFYWYIYFWEYDSFNFPGKKFGVRFGFPRASFREANSLSDLRWQLTCLWIFFSKPKTKRIHFGRLARLKMGGGEIFAGKTLGKILKLEGYLSSVFWGFQLLNLPGWRLGVVFRFLFLFFGEVMERQQNTELFVCLNFWSWAIRDDFGWRKIHHFCRRLQDERDQIEQQKLIEHFR